jgi:ketosteroid isomerase-like protein
MASDPHLAGDLATNKAVARSFFDAIVEGDTAAIDALLHPQARWWVQGWGDLSRAAFLTGLGQTITRARTRRYAVLTLTAEQDRVAVEATGSFEFPEGTYQNTYHFLFRMSDGRIVEGKEYLDTMVAARFYPPAAPGTRE